MLTAYKILILSYTAMRKNPKKEIVVAAVRLPRTLYDSIMDRVHIDAEDIDFSKFVRRAIRREFENSGFVHQSMGDNHASNA